MHPFKRADILLPQGLSFEKWSVIACDQFVSQPEYWEQVRQTVADAPSSLNLILPEADLEGDCTGAIQNINKTMLQYLDENIFQVYADCYIYVERTLLSGAVRCGVVGMVDLEQYDYTPQSQAAIRATEQTVAERIPPRMDIRRDAALEMPHVLLLCDDEQKLLIDSLREKKQSLPLLYDFTLMQGGGRICGWLVAGDDANAFDAALVRYAEAMACKYGKNPVLYAVGDGNHSLASAKGCYLENTDCTNARYALVELENIHDDSQVFEPIHRIVKNTDPYALLQAMEQAIGKPSGTPIEWHIGQEHGVFYVHSEEGLLPVGIVQNFLDTYMKTAPGVIDYIHGEDATRQLSQVSGTIGLMMPPVAKNAFFQGIIAGGTLPRKTFSMGHAQEKRYYLEARKIK